MNTQELELFNAITPDQILVKYGQKLMDKEIGFKQYSAILRKHKELTGGYSAPGCELEHDSHQWSACSKCHKPMEPYYDEIAKKITGYTWYCPCNPNLIVSIG